MRCRYGSLQSDSSLRCCGFIEAQASSAEAIRNYSARPIQDALHNSWRAMWSSFALSASRTSIRFGGTDRETGQCRQYQLAPEVSTRSVARSCRQAGKVSSTETRPWSPALWADYEAITAQGPNVSSRRLRAGASDPKRISHLRNSASRSGRWTDVGAGKSPSIPTFLMSRIVSVPSVCSVRIEDEADLN